MNWSQIKRSRSGNATKFGKNLIAPKKAVNIAVRKLIKHFPGTTKEDMVLTSCREELLVMDRNVRSILMCEFNGIYALYVDLENGEIHNAK